MEELKAIRLAFANLIEGFQHTLNDLNCIESKYETLLTPDELAALLKCTCKHIYDQAKRGDLPYYKSGSNLRFLYSEVLKTLKVEKK